MLGLFAGKIPIGNQDGWVKIKEDHFFEDFV